MLNYFPQASSFNSLGYSLVAWEMYFQVASRNGPGIWALVEGQDCPIDAGPHLLKRQRSLSQRGGQWRSSEIFQVEVFSVSQMLLGRVGVSSRERLRRKWDGKDGEKLGECLRGSELLKTNINPVEDRLENHPYRPMLWPLAICWCVRACMRRAIFIKKVFWGASPLHHTPPCLWGPMGKPWETWVPTWEKLDCRLISCTSTSGHCEPYNCSSFSSCSRPSAMRAKCMAEV